MDYVNAALNIYDQSLPLIELRGYVNMYLGSTESAIEDFTNCKEKNDRNPLYLANLSYAYSRANFYQESREVEQQLRLLDNRKDTGIVDYAFRLMRIPWRFSVPSAARCRRFTKTLSIRVILGRL